MKQAVISISGGKDSTAMILLAIERNIKNPIFVFADTGNEHPITYAYISYLRDTLKIKIDIVKVNFNKDIEHKKEVIRGKWVKEKAVTEEQAEELCKLLIPTGVPFLDLCIWKGRFPSTKSRFCSSELKHNPLDLFMIELIKSGKEVESWQGVRADESLNRKDLPMRERSEIYDIYRPIINWTAKDVFDLHKKHKLKPNPLYKQGMGRVGCMPCIHARKNELLEISERFPEVIDRIRKWERIVSKTSKRGNSTFFHASKDSTIRTKNNDEISIDSHGIDNIVEWSKTAWGGRQMALIEKPQICSSMYGLCE